MFRAASLPAGEPPSIHNSLINKLLLAILRTKIPLRVSLGRLSVLRAIPCTRSPRPRPVAAITEEGINRDERRQLASCLS